MATLTGYAAARADHAGRVELHADARACVEFETALAQGAAQQGRFRAERRLRRRDGSLLWVQVAARPVDGRPRGRRDLLLRRRRRTLPRPREPGRLQAERTRACSIRCWWASSPCPTAASTG
jgi:PAS domain-containing protein